jgi:hypothetical protein
VHQRERETHTHTLTRETKQRKHVGIQKSKTFVIMPLMKYDSQSEALVVAEIYGDEIKSRHRGEPQRERERDTERESFLIFFVVMGVKHVCCLTGHEQSSH